MSILTIYLKHVGDFENGDLHYSLDNQTYQELTDQTDFGVNPGDPVVFYAKDDSIKFIVDITVDEDKSGSTMDPNFWSLEPTAVPKTKRKVFLGVANPKLNGTHAKPKWNGFSIIYKLKKGPKIKDPGMRQPPPPGA